jgi:hypothetical protein
MKTAHDLVVQAKQAVQEISIDQAVMAIQSCDVLIDVRETEEYLAGHLPVPCTCRVACWSSRWPATPRCRRET